MFDYWRVCPEDIQKILADDSCKYEGFQAAFVSEVDSFAGAVNSGHGLSENCVVGFPASNKDVSQ